MYSFSDCSLPWLKTGSGGTQRVGQVEEGNFILNQRKPVGLKAYQAFVCYAEAGFRLMMKTRSLSHHNKRLKNHLQKAWLEIGRGALWCSEGCFSNSVAALHSSSDSGRMSHQENRGTGLLLVVRFGHALCLDFFLFVCLVGWLFVWIGLFWGWVFGFAFGLVFWLVFGGFFED